MTKFTVRLSDAQAAQLDALAAVAGVSRSLMVRRLIEAVDPSTAERLGSRDVEGRLQERARAGSTPALRELSRRQQAAELEQRLARLRATSA